MSDHTETAPASPEKHKLKLKKIEEVAPPPKEATSETARPLRSKVSKAETNRSINLMRFRVMWSWLLFLGLGLTMAVIRYGNLVDVGDYFSIYGPWVLLAFHILITGIAFQEDMFLGILCLFIPGYSAYYLLSQSGRPYLTALVFGVLIGIGEDSFYAIQEIAGGSYDGITNLLKGDR